MKFYDREAEMEVLRNNRIRSAKNSTFTVITGRRRIGKTSIVHESEKGNRFLYLFVPRKSETILCEQFAEAALKDLDLTLINTGRFKDLFVQIMQYAEHNNLTFVIDEFQELENINGSIMSSLQNLWDTHKGRSKINLIVCGSVYSMMVKIFQDAKEPLFGRATSTMKIEPFEPSVIREILKDHNPNYAPDDLLFLYMVTGGVPKYIELFMDAGATTKDEMLNVICTEGSQFLVDGEHLLITEFGKDYGTYFSILELIANGKTTMNEISTSIGKNIGSYLVNLEKRYGLIKKNRPMFSESGSRDIRWTISDNYLRFYFRFIDGNRSYMETKRFDILRMKILEEYEEYSGTVLEDYFKKKMTEEEMITDIGSYWDKKGHNEIDIIALNSFDKTAKVMEVKRNPKKADLQLLTEKADRVSELKKFSVKYGKLSLKDM
ncbi:MAG: ATP-binding protein [Methanomassiliicoccaceae archaeon]|nr:ATP-binding protein [Methanomassiliicoccaceae archaeon]